MFRTFPLVVLGMLLLANGALGQRSTPVHLLHPSGAANDQFGTSVAIDGDTLIVGAPLDDVGANTNQGSAHVYRWTGSGWAFEATLTSTAGAANDRFGISVAISGDTVVVGAHLDDVGASANQGRAYVFVRSGTAWTQQALLTAADGAANDNFGASVAIAGNTVVVGSANNDVGGNVNQGSAYVFTRSSNVWSQQARLTAADGAAGDAFGNAVAISGGTVLVGAWLDDTGAAVDQGAAYVFTRVGDAWAQQAKLAGSSNSAGDNFGSAVAISGDTAVVGASGDEVSSRADQGSAFVFTRTGASWTQQSRITASDGASGDNFGGSVALSGSTLIIGAVGTGGDQGTAHVYSRISNAWNRQTKLAVPGGVSGDRLGVCVALCGDTALVGASLETQGANSNQGSAWVFSRVGNLWIGPDLRVFAADGSTNDLFGAQVALAGDTAIVGAPWDAIGANTTQGSACIFVRSGTIWVQQAQLTAGDGMANDRFGWSVAISGDTALVGAWGVSINGSSLQGSAYVFLRSGTVWTQQAKLTAADGATSDFFGYSVAIAGDTAIVGAYRDMVGSNADQGSAYVFVRSGTSWTQQAKLTAADGARSDLFGCAVAISGDSAIVGAYGDDVSGTLDQGSAYVFVRSGTNWTQQARLSASDGAEADRFGWSVSLSGESALVGAYLDDVGSVTDQGSAYVFTRSGTAWTQQAKLVPTGGPRVDSFGASVSLFGDTALVGSSFSSTSAAFVFTRSGTTWAQRARLVRADGVTSATFGGSVSLWGDTALVGASDSAVDVNWAPGSAVFFDIPSDDLSLARNLMLNTTYSTIAASLGSASSGHEINATEAAWRAIATINPAGRQLTLSGSGDIRWPSTASVSLDGTSGLEASAGNNIEIFGSLSAGAAAVSTVNADRFRLGCRGSLTVGALGAVTIFSPIVTLEGATNLIDGSVVVVAAGSLSIAPHAALFAPSAASRVDVAGSFDCAIDSNERFDMRQATLKLNGSGAEQKLEVMSTDLGATPLGLDPTLPGHYPLGTLRIGPGNSVVRLVDDHDNDGLGQAGSEAIYVDRLIIRGGSRLVNPSCRIYYNTLTNNGAVDVPENLIQIPVLCYADFNQDGGIDGADVDVFFVAWENGDFSADVNLDGGIDGSDVDAFFAAWETGACE
ncbi:MAG: hypothetical protein JSR77_05680 [Planctomycetes bacterium]|nr:hypothetical protein [Planctomycetota bacterium]